MADENKPSSSSSSFRPSSVVSGAEETPSSENSKTKPNKSINVTQPRPSSAVNIDTSKVSDYTLREQAALDKLASKVGKRGGGQKEDKSGGFKTAIAIILVIILIILAVVFVMVLNRTGTAEEQDYDMRLSMQIENKSALSIITETGKEQLREINPGDIIPLRATVRNSSDVVGEEVDDSVTPPSIYVRFKLVLILDYEERYDIMIPTMTNRWYKYNQETEDKLPGGVVEDDHYYYFLGALSFMQPEVLFSSIEFSGEAITCDDGGKYGQIQVKVESVEADIDNIVNRTLWPTAPQQWIIKMVQNQTSGNTGADGGDMNM